MKIFILLAILFANVFATSHLQRDEEINNKNSLAKQDVNYRLDDTVSPIHYEIAITPYFRTEGANLEFTFSGKVSIQLHATVPNINKIVLHQKNLIISSIKLEGGNANTTIELPYTYDNVTEKLTIDTGIPQMTVSSAYTLTIIYTGTMDTNMEGFYRSSYVEDGLTK